MKLKTVQWNIGGGKLVNEGQDPTLLGSYNNDGIGAIIDLLREQNADEITLQETHTSEKYSQPQIIAEALGYAYWVNDEYADSHIEQGKRLGQSIISRFPVKDHKFELFDNPHFEAVWEDGSVVKSHDKGCSRGSIELAAGKSIMIQTLHAIPFRRFYITFDDEKAKLVFKSMDEKIRPETPGILQGDFNIDTPDMEDVLPDLFAAGYEEVVQTKPTTPRGHRFDRVFYSGISVISTEVLSYALTDHYPVVTTFEEIV